MRICNKVGHDAVQCVASNTGVVLHFFDSLQEGAFATAAQRTIAPADDPVPQVAVVTGSFWDHHNLRMILLSVLLVVAVKSVGEILYTVATFLEISREDGAHDLDDWSGHPSDGKQHQEKYARWAAARLYKVLERDAARAEERLEEHGSRPLGAFLDAQGTEVGAHESLPRIAHLHQLLVGEALAANRGVALANQDHDACNGEQDEA